MIEENEIVKIKEYIGEFLTKMAIPIFTINVAVSAENEKSVQSNVADPLIQPKDSVDVNIGIDQDPQILIGQSGQTLLEITRLLRIMLNKKLQKDFYINLDINDYKKKKIEYLKDLATSMANEVARTGEQKTLPPMPSYERKIIHATLSLRQDVWTQSQGEGLDRHLVITPK